MKQCKKCNQTYRNDQNFCKTCGDALVVVSDTASIIYQTKENKCCTQCNITYDSDKKFCKICGAQLTIISTEISKVDAKIMVYEEKLKSNQLNITVLSEYAQFLFDNERYKYANSILLRIGAIDEKNQFAKNLLFNSYLKLKQYSDALSIGEELLLIDEKNISLIFQLAETSFALNMQAKEMIFYNKVLDIEPNNIIALEKKASSLLKKNLITDALPLFDKLHSLSQTQRVTIIYAGISKIINKDFKTGIGLLHYSILNESDVHNSRGYLFLAYALCQTNGELDDIERHFKKIRFNDLKSSPFALDEEFAAKAILHIVAQKISTIQSLNESGQAIDKIIQYYLVSDESYYTKSTYPILAETWFVIGLKQKELGLFSDAEYSFQKAFVLNADEKKYKQHFDEALLIINKNNKKSNIKKAVLISVVLLAIIGIVVGINISKKNAENKIWETAKFTNSWQSYQEYATKYPNGQYIQIANHKYDSLLWADAIKQNSPNGYQSYIALCPKGESVNLATLKYDSLINEDKKLQEAKANRCIDIDGNIYKTVRIGNQLWMAENLKVTHYRNGEAIPNVTDNEEWSNLKSGAYCNYKNNANYGQKYGRLYNWYAVDDTRGLAPAGWHVPTDEEWRTLIQFLGGENVAGGKLKSKLQWKQPNLGATNESGFNGLPCGGRYSANGGIVGEFDSTADDFCSWRTSTMSAENGASFAWSIMNNEIKVNHEEYYATPCYGMSVRCVKNTKIKENPSQNSTDQSTVSSNSQTESGSLPVWLKGSHWILRNQYGIVCEVKFGYGKYLNFKMLDSGFMSCEYEIPNNLNCIFFKYNGVDVELWINKKDYIIETKTGQRLSPY